MLSAPHTIAILDVDGTLFPGALGIELLHELMRANACNRAAAEQVLAVVAEHRGGAVEFSSMATHTYQAFAAAIAGRETAVIEDHARRLWTTQRERLFEFVPALISSLRARGYTIMLISGSPLETIRLVAAELDIREAYGAVFTREHGRYTGGLDLSSGVPGEKARIFAAATSDREVCASLCLAIGDSLTDVALFECVGLPLAFEPGPELATIASARGWASATRTDVLTQVDVLLARNTPAAVPPPSRN